MVEFCAWPLAEPSKAHAALDEERLDAEAVENIIYYLSHDLQVCQGPFATPEGPTNILGGYGIILSFFAYILMSSFQYMSLIWTVRARYFGRNSNNGSYGPYILKESPYMDLNVHNQSI